MELDAWWIYFVPMRGTRKGKDFLAIELTFDWSRLFEGLEYDFELHELRMPISMVGEQVTKTAFGTAWRLSAQRTLMFVRADPVTHGYRLCLATRDSEVVERMKSLGMTQEWYPAVNPDAD